MAEITVDKITKDLHKRLAEVHWAYFTYTRIRQLRAPNIVGKKIAEKNLLIINKYRDFFLPVSNSLNHEIFLQLGKFFDKDRNTKRIQLLLDLVVKVCPKEKMNELNSLKNRLTKINGIIERIKSHRHEAVAHDAIVRVAVVVSHGEIEDVMSFLQDLLTFCSGVSGTSLTIYDHIKTKSVAAVDGIFEDLHAARIYRRTRTR